MIFRPSILVSTDDTESSFGYYSVAKAILANLRVVSRVPLIVYREAALNIIDVNVAVRWMCDIAEQRLSSALGFFHIVNPHPLSVFDTLKSTLRGFGVENARIIGAPEWLARTTLNTVTFVLSKLNGLRKLGKLLKYYSPYLLQTTIFETGESKSLIRGFSEYDKNLFDDKMIRLIASKIIAQNAPK